MPSQNCLVIIDNYYVDKQKSIKSVSKNIIWFLQYRQLDCILVFAYTVCNCTLPIHSPICAHGARCVQRAAWLVQPVPAGKNCQFAAS